MRPWAIVLVTLSLTGCMTQTYFNLPAGKTNEDFQRTLAKCRAESARLPVDPGETGLWPAAFQQQYILNCLRAEGYTVQKR